MWGEGELGVGGVGGVAVCMCILMKKTLGCCLVGLISRELQTTDDAQVSSSSALIHLFIY